MYSKELRYLKKKTPFECKHGIDITSLGPAESGKGEEIALDGTVGVSEEDREDTDVVENTLQKKIDLENFRIKCCL